jgi:type II secretory pathway component GspD/PulD (secretin)
MRASIVLPYAPTNGLIIAATEDRLAQMLVVVRALDQASAVKLRVFPLRYSDATVLASQLAEALQPGIAPALPWRVVVDARTNSLVVSGPAARLAEVRDLIVLLDVPSRSASGFHVVRVVNAEAETLATHLRGLDFGQDRPGVPSAPSIDVVTDEATNSLVISAAPAAFAEIARVIGEIDRIPPRVAIDVHIWDVETRRQLDLGFDALPVRSSSRTIQTTRSRSRRSATSASLLAPEATRPSWRASHPSRS